jgi:hypothetical protein
MGRGGYAVGGTGTVSKVRVGRSGRGREIQGIVGADIFP